MLFSILYHSQDCLSIQSDVVSMIRLLPSQRMLCSYTFWRFQAATCFMWEMVQRKGSLNIGIRVTYTRIPQIVPRVRDYLWLAILSKNVGIHHFESLRILPNCISPISAVLILRAADFFFHVRRSFYEASERIAWLWLQHEQSS